MRFSLTYPRFFISTLLVLGLITAGRAQPGSIRVGVEGGLVLSSLYGADFVNAYNPRLGYLIGVTGKYQVLENLVIHTGVGLTRKGSTFDIDVTDSSGHLLDILHVVDNFDFLRVPLLFQLESGNKLRYGLAAGPYAGLLLKQERVIEDSQFSSDNTDDFNDLELGVSLGASLIYPLGPRFQLTLGLQGDYGLTNMNQSGDPVIKTKALNIFLGVNFSPCVRRENATTPAEE